MLTVIQGDALEVLRTLESESVNCCVTSPPYFGLRDYGIKGQIGLEPTPAEYVEKLVTVFREVRRVLRADGTLWLNLGDTYAGSRCGPNGDGETGRHVVQSDTFIRSKRAGKRWGGGDVAVPGLKPKDLIGIPWMVAFALRADGWYLRSDIVWNKPNPMPESVTDRPARSHEFIFLLTKSARYYYDAEAIKEPLVRPEELERATPAVFGGRDKHAGYNTRKHSGNEYTRPQLRRARELAAEKGLTEEHIEAIRSVGLCDAGKAQVTQSGFGKNTERVLQLAAEAKEALGGYFREFTWEGGRNKRDVWTVTTKPYAEAHFATFPPDLIKPCVLAGCPAGGTILDPFAGSGTTGKVAIELGRKAVLVELNPEYIPLIEQRCRTTIGLPFGAEEDVA